MATLADTDGGYAGVATNLQALFDLRDFDGSGPVIGSWVVDGDPCGMGSREDGLVTGNTARFVPQLIEG